MSLLSSLDGRWNLCTVHRVCWPSDEHTLCAQCGDPYVRREPYTPPTLRPLAGVELEQAKQRMREVPPELVGKCVLEGETILATGDLNSADVRAMFAWGKSIGVSSFGSRQ